MRVVRQLRAGVVMHADDPHVIVLELHLYASGSVFVGSCAEMGRTALPMRQAISTNRGIITTILLLNCPAMKKVLLAPPARHDRRLRSRRRGASEGRRPDPWFGTFSIIAFDPATNELGVGVQSRAFGAGAAVPYAKPGVGAVATQASANRQYGPKAIALLEQGLSPAEVVKRITDEDPGRDTRQVAVIDTKGRSAVYTGKRVIDRNSDPKDLVHLGGYAGHVTGDRTSRRRATRSPAPRSSKPWPPPIAAARARWPSA